MEMKDIFAIIKTLILISIIIFIAICCGYIGCAAKVAFKLGYYNSALYNAFGSYACAYLIVRVVRTINRGKEDD
ncbi:hypothetical protein [Metaclostridioides mangenotii]|uniref:Uncharacterized protein n=1 Tax=Metaclostridioides mangenotii TaxID=1540 RepID=A0ABS4EBS4_9FIRM|nr:hypothetical protein [Clostridioides mangenotii]MBP1855392.1 hypothetical protein [Clostridioides mangenotii]